METPLSTLEFLARSENRVQVLQLLASGTCTRDELAETTGASQATLGRILEDFRARSWARRQEGGYVATATGQLLAEGVTELLETLETEQKLRAIVPYLPADALGFDLTYLADATVTTPTQTRPTAPLRRLLARMRDAERLTAVSHTLNEQSLAVVTEQVTAGPQRFEGVFGEGAIEALARDAESWETLTRLAADEDAKLWVRSNVPFAATVEEAGVTFLLRDEDGVVRAAVETDHPAVRDWVTDTVERYRETATPFTPASYAPE